MDRRSMLNSTAAMATGAVAGCALPGTAAQGPKTPFSVPATYIPIVGSRQRKSHKLRVMNTLNGSSA